MRTKKAAANFTVNFVMLLVSIVPLFILRKVFLDTLGSDFLGLSALFTSLIGLLSLADLGISTAIIYALYKPFAEKDYEKIMGYIHYYTKFYQAVGLIIFVFGIALLPFFPLFINGEIAVQDAQLYFLIALVNTIITYFFSAKFSLLIVAQEGYRITLASTTSIVLTAMIQMVALYLYQNFYIFLLIQLVINLIYLIAITIYINKRFAWQSGINGTIEISEKRKLKKNIKALFIHKVGEYGVFGTDNLLISYFVNIVSVGIYNSYYMVIAVAMKLVHSAFNGITASIGNLLIAEEKEIVFAIHKKLFFFNFWIASFLAISMFNTIQQFILLWLGDSQYLNTLTISIILLNVYITLMRVSVEKFKEAGGLYQQDQYSAIIEAVINLVFSIILVQYMGLPGIFLGTLISNFTVVFWVKPKMVYKYIFQEKLRIYFIMYFKYFSIALLTLLLTHIATQQVKLIITLPAFLLNCILNIGLINIFYFLVFRNTEEFLFFEKLVMNKVAKWVPRRKIN